MVVRQMKEDADPFLLSEIEESVQVRQFGLSRLWPLKAACWRHVAVRWLKCADVNGIGRGNRKCDVIHTHRQHLIELQRGFLSRGVPENGIDIVPRVQQVARVEPVRVTAPFDVRENATHREKITTRCDRCRDHNI